MPGPVMDLMGFAVAPDGLLRLRAGTGTDLPQPLGLIRSKTAAAAGPWSPAAASSTPTP